MQNSDDQHWIQSENEFIVQNSDDQHWIQSDKLLLLWGLLRLHTGAATPQDLSQLLQREALREQHAAASVDYGQPPPQSQS